MLSQRAINTAQKDAGIVNLSVTGVFKTAEVRHLVGSATVYRAKSMDALSIEGHERSTREKRLKRVGCGGKNSK